MASQKSTKFINRRKRQQRIRIALLSANAKPRVSIFRSNRHLNVQIIDDATGKTLVSAHDIAGKKGKSVKGPKVERATDIGRRLAELAVKAGIKNVVFDRGGYKYHGRVKAVAEALRAGGLTF